MKNNIVFEEVGRINQTDDQDLVVAKMRDKATNEVTAYFINYYITDWNGGPIKKPLKGVKVSQEELTEFLNLFGKDLLKEALDA